MRRILMSFVLAIPMISSGQTIGKFVTKEENIRENMIRISRELGVTCNACHNVQNFTLDDKKAYKVSKEHMKITQMLKDKGFDGKNGPEATCFMCHRGKLVPAYKEPNGNKVH